MYILASLEKNITNMAKNIGTLPKTIFPLLLNDSLNSLKNAQQNALGRFKSCGIISLDRTQMLKQIPLEQTEETEDHHPL